MLKLLFSFLRPEPKQREQRTSFLSLPRELRDEVYRYCFIHPTPLLPNFTPRHTLPVALLRTCKQIHYEAAEILYSENTFEIGLNLYVWWTGDTGWTPSGVLMGLHSSDAVPGNRPPIQTYRRTDSDSNTPRGDSLRSSHQPITKDKIVEADTGERIPWSKALLDDSRTWPSPTYHTLPKRLKLRINLTWGLPLARSSKRRDPHGLLDTFAANLDPFLQNAQVELQFRVREKGPGAFVTGRKVDALWPTLDVFRPFAVGRRVGVTSVVEGKMEEGDRVYLVERVLARGEGS